MILVKLYLEITPHLFLFSFCSVREVGIIYKFQCFLHNMKVNHTSKKNFLLSPKGTERRDKKSQTKTQTMQCTDTVFVRGRSTKVLHVIILHFLSMNKKVGNPKISSAWTGLYRISTQCTQNATLHFRMEGKCSNRIILTSSSLCCMHNPSFPLCSHSGIEMQSGIILPQLQLKECYEC